MMRTSSGCSWWGVGACRGLGCATWRAVTSWKSSGWWISSPRRRPRAPAEAGLKVPHFTELAPALEQTEPTVVCDVTIPEAHAGVAGAALRAGCHVASEKPMAHSLEAARATSALAAAAGLNYAVMQNRRYRPAIRAVRDIVASGALGDLGIVNADFYLGPHFGGFRDAMQSPLLLDMAIHTFDQARFITGSDPLAVYCHEFNPGWSWYAHGAAATAVFEMTGGLVFTYRGCWCSEARTTSWESAWRLGRRPRDAVLGRRRAAADGADRRGGGGPRALHRT